MSLFGFKEKKEIERLRELLPDDGKKVIALEEELVRVNQADGEERLNYVKARAGGAYSVAGNVSNFICF